MAPSFLVITAHDLGRALGCLGAPGFASPCLDAWARDAVVFDRAFATAPQCSPARAALFTGRWPHETGVMGLCHEPFGWDLAAGERHLAGRLAEAGWKTAMVGVCHEANLADPQAAARRLGFAEFEPTVARDRIVRDAESFLDARKADGALFYLQVGFLEPHRSSEGDPPGADYMGFLTKGVARPEGSGVAPPAYLPDTPGARTEMAEIAAAVAALDAAVGRILNALARSGRASDTCVIFTTDHGLALPGAKCTLHDSGLEAALIVRPPRGVAWRPGRRAELVSHLDVLPTVLELAGQVPAPELRGCSLSPLLRGPGDGEWRPRAALPAELTYHNYYLPMRSLRTERHRLIVHFSSGPAVMDCSQSWRPRSDPPRRGARAVPAWELYDLLEDPDGLRDRAGDPALARVRDELAADLYAWMRATDDPLLAGPVAAPQHGRTLAALQAAAGRVGAPDAGLGLW